MAGYQGQAALTRYQKRKQHARMVNDFADLLADGLSARLAAQELGMKPSWGNSTLAHIRRGLGDQAR